MCSGNYLDFINIDARTKFDKNPSIKILSINKILTLIKGHNAVENYQKKKKVIVQI